MHRTFKLHLILLLAAALIVPFLAHAADEPYNCNVKSANASLLTKAGSPYMRVICSEQRETAGVKYDTGIPVTFFDYAGDAPAPGATVTMIVTKGEYNGRPSYLGHAIATK